MKLKRTEPGGSILLLKLTKLTNLTKPKLMKKNVPQRYWVNVWFPKCLVLNNCKIIQFLNLHNFKVAGRSVVSEKWFGIHIKSIYSPIKHL